MLFQPNIYCADVLGCEKMQPNLGYTSVAPSPKGEGWDEGKCKGLILISSPQPSLAGGEQGHFATMAAINALYLRY